MSVFSDTPSSRTPSPNLPYPRSKISVVNSRVGFKFQGVDELHAGSSASRLSLVRRKHLSHIGALQEDGFDFLPPDVAQALNENLTSPVEVNPRSQLPIPLQPQPRMTWKDRLLASASASTLKIKGISKKLKNKVILLRDVVVPSSFNPPPPPTYHSAATPATPTPFANLPPPTKHEFSSQRIVCIRDLGLALDEEDAEKSGRLFAKEDEDGADAASRLMSPAWPHRKHLSTLPEESDGLTSHLSDEEDDAPQPDVYVQAVLMPVENLGRPVRGGGMPSPIRNQNSPARSRVSPPWMHQSLHDASTSTLRLGGHQQTRDRPLTGSSAGDVKTPLHAAISPTSSILRFDGFRLSGEDPGLLSPYHESRRRQSVLSFLSSTASSYGTNARRRASSLIMLPVDNHHSSHRSSRVSSGRGRSSTFSAAAERDKENHGGYPSATFGKNGRTKQHQVTEQYDEDTEESDDDDEGEEQEYYVFEADPRDLDPTSPVKEGPDGKRESVLVLLPVPNTEAEAQQQGWPDLKSRWSHSDLGSGVGGGSQQEVVSNPFLTPLPSGGLGGVSLPPSSTYDPSVRDSRYSRGSRRGWDRDSYGGTNTNTGRGAGMGGRLESAWEEEEEEGEGAIEPYLSEQDQGPPTPSATNPFLTPAPSGFGKPLPNIPTPSENPSTWSLGSYKTAPTIPSRNQSTTHVVPPPMNRNQSSGLIPTIPSTSWNPSFTHIPTIPGASRNNSTTQIPTTTPRSRASSGAQVPQISQTLGQPPPPYNRHGTQVQMPGAFGSKSRSRVHVPQTIEEPEPEELDEIDIDADEETDEEVDERLLAEIDVSDQEEVLPRSVGPKNSRQGLASRPGFVALPVPIPSSKASFSKENGLSGAQKRSREPVSETRQRTQSKPLPPSRPESTQSPPPPAPVSVPAQVHGAPKPSKPYSSRHILSMREFDQLEAEKAAQQPGQQDRRSPNSQQRPRQVPRPLSPLNSDIVPAPVPSPSFPPAPLAPPKVKTPKPRPVRKNSVSSTGSSRSRRGAAARKRSGSQPKPIIVVDEEGRMTEVVDEDEEGQLPSASATITRRNRSQSIPNPTSPLTPTRPHSSSTFGAPTSPVRTRTKTKARIPIPQALLEGETLVDIPSPRTRAASNPTNIVRSGSQKSTKAKDQERATTKAPTRPLPPQPMTNSPRSYPRAEVVTPTPSNGSRKSRAKSSNPSTPKMTYKQGLADDGNGRAQRKEAEEWMKSSGRAFQGQACSIEVQVVDEGDTEFGRKESGGGYVDRSGSQRSKVSDGFPLELG
ncbi:hypothetical protein FRC05_005415 [Tulasnella sp. 425]|nr:hypothetical protein FRC05_005415 [Tulasnella sp. 425]